MFYYALLFLQDVGVYRSFIYLLTYLLKQKLKHTCYTYAVNN